ncbi:transposable element Tcb2 transposase [Trichonephila clavipes]|nr:transposable element Tcb2 transposase [Trichonephila clavipes]
MPTFQVTRLVVNPDFACVIRDELTSALFHIMLPTGCDNTFIEDFIGSGGVECLLEVLRVCQARQNDSKAPKGRQQQTMLRKISSNQYDCLLCLKYAVQNPGEIIGMMEARGVARQLGRSDYVVRRCWDQWIREMSFTRRTGSGRSQQTSRGEDRHIIRNARVQPIASSAAIQAQVAPSLGAPVSSQTIRRCLAEGHLGSRCPLRVLPLTPTHRRLRLE